MASNSSLFNVAFRRVRQNVSYGHALRSLAFVACLLLFEAYLFHFDYVAYFSALARDTRGSGQLYLLFAAPPVLLCALLVSAAFVYVSIASPAPMKAIYLAVFAVAIIVEYGFMKAQGNFSTPSMTYVAMATFEEANIWIDATEAYTNAWATIPILVFAVLLFTSRPILRRPRVAGITVVASAFVFFSAVYPFTWDGTFPTVSLSAFFRTASTTPWYLRQTLRQVARRPAIPVSPTAHPGRNVVLIVDESVRGDHLSVNGYGRPTTPYLEELRRRGLLLTWGRAVSGATCTRLSNMLLATGALPNEMQDVAQFPLLFQYARAAGYRTLFFDAQQSSMWWATQSDVKYINTWKNSIHFAKYRLPFTEIDFAVADEVRRVIMESEGNFIWINKVGSHFDYNHAYPPEAQRWKPVWSKGDTLGDPASHEKLVNSYDNALLYNVEGFFRRVVTPETLRTSIFVYTSDHGQTLSDHGEQWTHCRDSNNEVVVPALIVAEGLKGPFDTAYPASHSNLFATLLDLMEYPNDARAHHYAPSLLGTHRTEPVVRHYLTAGRQRVLTFDER